MKGILMGVGMAVGAVVLSQGGRALRGLGYEIKFRKDRPSAREYGERSSVLQRPAHYIIEVDGVPVGAIQGTNLGYGKYILWEITDLNWVSAPILRVRTLKKIKEQAIRNIETYGPNFIEVRRSWKKK